MINDMSNEKDMIIHLNKYDRSAVILSYKNEEILS